jgi:hypothetical protein
MVQEKKAPKIKKRISKRRDKADEHYVIDLCDEILGLKADRQHCFDFLRGDSCKDGVLKENTGKMLPVDAYYEKLNLVIEYWEKQHTESTPFFDNKMTSCGITRKEQREKYDKRREEVLPQNGIKLLTIQYSDFGTSKRIKRDHDRDIAIVKKILADKDILTNDK